MHSKNLRQRNERLVSQEELTILMNMDYDSFIAIILKAVINEEKYAITKLYKHTVNILPP